MNFKAQLTGLITGVLMVAASMLSFYALKQPIESNFQLLIYAIFTAGIIWSIYNFNSSCSAQNSFATYFSVGFKTFVVTTLIMALYTFVFFNYNSAFRDEKIAENSRLLLQEGSHLPAEIEENAKQLKIMFMPLMISSAVFRYLIIGAIISAIGAVFFSSKAKHISNKPMPETE